MQVALIHYFQVRRRGLNELEADSSLMNRL